MRVVPTLYLRDVPATLVERLRRRARRNRRSMSAEAVAILKQTLDGDLADEDLMARFRRLQYTVPENAPDAVELIRKGREERERRYRL